MKQKVLISRRHLAGILAIGVVIALLFLVRGWQQARAEITTDITSPLLAYSDTLALVRFQVDGPVAPVSSLGGACGPVEGVLQDKAGEPLAQVGATTPNAGFMACTTDETGISHYTLIFWGDFRARPPHQIQIRFLHTTSDALSNLLWKGFKKASWASIIGPSHHGVSLTDALQTPNLILLRLCAQLPSAEDWHPRGELLLNGEVWEIVSSGIPNFRKPGALGTSERCFIALLEKSSSWASRAETTHGVQFHLRWERSLPECFSAEAYRRDIEPFLQKHGLSPEHAGLTQQLDFWCLGTSIHPDFWEFLQKEWRYGPTYTLQLAP